MMPLISYMYAVVFWLLASWSLGEWAIPGIHDPGGFLFGIPLFLHIVLMLLALAVAPFAFALGWLPGRRVQHALAYIASLILSVLLFRLDIYQVTTWIAD